MHWSMIHTGPLGLALAGRQFCNIQHRHNIQTELLLDLAANCVFEGKQSPLYCCGVHTGC